MAYSHCMGPGPASDRERDWYNRRKGFWSLSLSLISVNISTWYYTSHLVPGPIPDPSQCGINIPQECIPIGCVLSAAVPMSIPACTGQGGCVSQHALGRGVSVHGGLPRARGCLPKGVYPTMHWGRHPPVDRMTDRCKKKRHV